MVLLKETVNYVTGLQMKANVKKKDTTSWSEQMWNMVTISPMLLGNGVK